MSNETTEMIETTEMTIPSSLHDRLGGDVFFKVMLCEFYDNLTDTNELKHFFFNVPKETIKTHHVKFFRMIFGPDHMKPHNNEIFDYLLLTHSMMFQIHGLNETHFDLVAQCLIRTMDELFIDQSLIDECVTILLPYRDLFAYGAQIAINEKNMTPDEMKHLPICSATMIGTDIPAVLPTHPMSTIPDWLIQEIKNVSDTTGTTTTVRDWTSNLADRFTAHGDVIVGDTLLDIPFNRYEAYIATFIQLAFLPMKNTYDVDDNTVHELVHTVQHPPSFMKPILPLVLYDRMIQQFELTCIDMYVNEMNRKVLVENLQQYRSKFENVTPKQLNGIRGLHSLSQKLLESKQKSTSDSMQCMESDVEGSIRIVDVDMLYDTKTSNFCSSNSTKNNPSPPMIIDDMTVVSFTNSSSMLTVSTTKQKNIHPQEQKSSSSSSFLATKTSTNKKSNRTFSSWIKRSVKKMFTLQKKVPV